MGKRLMLIVVPRKESGVHTFTKSADGCMFAVIDSSDQNHGVFHRIANLNYDVDG
jgi:hypothetical protein